MEGVGERVAEVSALLVHGGQVRANDAEGVGPLGSTKAAGDLLLDFGHAHSLFGDVVGERHRGLTHKAPDILGVFARTVQQVGREALLRATPLARGRRAWIGLLPLILELHVLGVRPTVKR